MTLSRILLVDDDDNIRTIAELSLEDDFQVDIASSGQEAIDIAMVRPPDLILLDVMMPGLDGKATFSRFKEIPLLRAIPVVFMTAKVLTHEIDFYLELGAAGVISKPFDPLTLAEEVQTIWAHSRV